MDRGVTGAHHEEVEGGGGHVAPSNIVGLLRARDPWPLQASAEYHRIIRHSLNRNRNSYFALRRMARCQELIKNYNATRLQSQSEYMNGSRKL
jgi:hypothetical protein